ncbi:MAG: hypothetical protein A2W93_13565 [Bacteroidetes bacterium GWF2_43_63]|nr:MAG: hypothetical protein A2W94_03760 [Bacteroidetes bacterium GWE2_42_42]OFY55018.1 MAG: hypothetical protein A2W93_13565 [Bacteroidetes bacterium GWF2_43_63]HBG69553.1 hypothetical protein [Bacteroidales bacterium]HCB60708.1 hypothetical protein [Bacteroidales bacterium]HCY23988.1 hypothetical protein [Bacteroidales bacterium]
MIKWLITGFLLSFGLMATAQTISGTIKDADGMPVSGVHIFCEGENVGEVSDAKGQYSFDVNGCSQIVIRHISYEQKIISATELQKNPNIFLNDFAFLKNGIDIYSKPIIALLPDTPLFVHDYEICDGKIFMCAFFQRKLNQSVLLYTDLNGRIIDSESLSETGDLYRDPEGAIYIAQKNYAYQLFTDNNRISFSESFESKHVYAAREHWTHSVGDSLVLQYYYFRNQGVGYFIKQLPDDSARLFLEFIDEASYDRMAMGPYFDGNEFDQRFEEMIVYKPVQIPIFFKENDIVAFNFISWKIQYFDLQGNLLSETDMQYGDKNKLRKEIYFDAETGRYYGREIRNGLNSLIEIDINTGKMIQYFSFKGYPHIEKLCVSNGVLYFIYKDYSGDEYKRLYKSPLNNMVAGR